MNEKEINDLVEKKILEAKLEIADKKFNFLILIAGGLLAIFGIIVPIWWANTSSDKVDKSIALMNSESKSISETNQKQLEKFEAKTDKLTEQVQLKLKDILDAQNDNLKTISQNVDKETQQMENNFKELAGTQLRKPVLICKYGSDLLENVTVILNKKNEHNAVLELKNIGDAVAKNIRIRLYMNIDKDVSLRDGLNYGQHYFDEKNYNKVCDINVYNFNSLDPKDSHTIDLGLFYDGKESLEIPALLKIYYEQPEPIRYNFRIKYDNK